MKKETKAIVKKAAKVAGVPCVAAGAAALMTSATEIKAMTEGGKYLKDTVQKIFREEPKAEVPAAEESSADAEVVEAEAATGE